MKLHRRKVELRVAELERAVGTFRMSNTSSSSSVATARGTEVDVEMYLANRFADAWGRSAADRYSALSGFEHKCEVCLCVRHSLSHR